jgi:trans-aconitate methyltransferase
MATSKGKTEKWDAGLYDGKHAFVWELAKDLVPLLGPKAGERILDIGCGTGHLTAEIAASGAEVLGIDRSEEMIAEARKKFPEIRFEVMDAKEMPFAKEFDGVFSNATLHWIKEPERVIAGIARALKPGGRFVAEFGGKGNVAGFIEAVRRACGSLGIEFSDEMRPWYFPSGAEYAGLLEKHGLEVRQAALFDRPTPLEDGERGLRVWMEMFGGAILRNVPETKREALLQETEREARAELFRDGRWILDYRRLRIVAEKG